MPGDPNIHLLHLIDPPLADIVAWEGGLGGGDTPLSLLINVYIIKGTKIVTKCVTLCNFDLFTLSNFSLHKYKKFVLSCDFFWRPPLWVPGFFFYPPPSSFTDLPLYYSTSLWFWDKLCPSPFDGSVSFTECEKISNHSFKLGVA